MWSRTTLRSATLIFPVRTRKVRKKVAPSNAQCGRCLRVIFSSGPEEETGKNARPTGVGASTGFPGETDKNVCPPEEGGKNAPESGRNAPETGRNACPTERC